MTYTTIGFSTDCLPTLSLSQRMAFFRFADALELYFETEEALQAFTPTTQDLALLRSCNRLTVHAPITNIRYTQHTPALHLLGRLCSHLPIKGVVFHPDTLSDLSLVEHLPALIENMGSGKKTGTHSEDFKEYKQYNVDFVLDIQHIYEHDPSLKQGAAFLHVMADRLAQVHVSGCNSTYSHAPLKLSDNKEVLSAFLKRTSAPRICEGYFETPQQVHEEYDYLKDFSQKPL